MLPTHSVHEKQVILMSAEQPIWFFLAGYPVEIAVGIHLWEGNHESRRCSRDTYPES